MKKTFITALALSSVAMAAIDPMENVTYTWGDFSSDPLGGTWKENATPMTPVTTSVSINGQAATALTSYLESRGGNNFFKEAIIAAAENDGRTFSISFDYLYKAGHTSWGQAIFHIDAKNNGITIASSGTGRLSVFTGNAANDADYVTKAEAVGVEASEAMTLNSWNKVQVTFGTDYNVEISLNDTIIGTTTLSDISWTTESANYCFGEIAPGWQSDGQKPFNDSGAMIANVKVAYTPEPATATLSLLALAGLAARRRRH